MKKLTRYILLLLLIILPITISATPPSPDSVTIKLFNALSSGDSLKIDTFVQSNRFYSYKFLQRNLEDYFSSGHEQMLKSIKLVAEAIFRVFDDYFYISQIEYYRTIIKDYQKSRIKIIDHYDSLNSVVHKLSPDSGAQEFESIALQFLDIYDTSAAIKAMQSSGFYYSRANMQSDALGLLLESINLSQLCNDLDGLGRSYNLLGAHYIKNSQYLNAGEYFDSARVVANLLGNDRGEADAINNIAKVYLESGNKKLALEYSKAALDIYRNHKEYHEKNFNSAQALLKMISTYRDITPLEELKNWLAELENIYSLGIYTNVGTGIYQARAEVTESSGDLETALKHYKNANKNLSVLISIARVYSKLGKYNHALDANQLVIQSALKRKNYKALGLIHHNLGVIYQRLGDYETAVSHYIQSLDYKQSQNRQHEMVETFLSLTDIYLSANAIDQAKKYFINAHNLSKELQIPKLQARTYLMGAKLYSKLGDTSTTNDYLDSALSLYKENNNLQGKFDTYILKAEITRINKDLNQAFQNLEIASTIAKRLNNNKNIRQLETITGLIFYDSNQLDSAYIYLARSIRWLENNRHNIIDPSLRSFQSSHNRFIYEKMVLLFLHDGKMKSLDSATAYIEMAKARTLQEMIQQNRSEYLSTDELYLPDPNVLQKVSSELDNPQTAILNYFLTPEKSILMVITNNGKQIFELPTRQQITNHLIEYLELLQLSIKDEKLLEPLKQKAIELSSLLLAGFENQISGYENIYIIPDGALSTLPFETLILNDKYLIETSSVTLLPSLSFYLLERKKYDSNGKLLMIAAPNYQGKYSPLKYSLEESQAIVELFAANSKKVMTGQDANKENLRAWDVLNYDYLHFATHTYIDHQEPLKSKIILADDSTGSSADLTLEEIMSLRLNADLVVLSSCESGGGRFHLGEGIDGFVRGFLYAGAHNIVVSLWSVEDFTTSIFMKEFYQNLELGYASALRLAKLKLINSPRRRFRHPYYWSPFVLVQGK